METIEVISGDKDGADLRREKMRHKYYIRCDSKADDEQINDAIQSVGKSRWFGLLGDDWDRIFGGK